MQGSALQGVGHICTSITIDGMHRSQSQLETTWQSLSARQARRAGSRPMPNAVAAALACAGGLGVLDGAELAAVAGSRGRVA